MKRKKNFWALIASALLVPVAVIVVIVLVKKGETPARPEGPCDVYQRGGAPCAAAHSSTRALYAAYDGPLYQVMRQSDGKRLDIGVVKPSAGDPGGYADAEAQDKFCKDTYCWVTILYDQSGNGNDLYQAPRGGFSGNAMGGFNNVPMADWAPVTLMGHKVYGLFITPGSGLRWNDAKGTAVDDQAEGQYWVVDGHHFNGGCCFDYGNAETDSRDDGDGTMETTYYGNIGAWYRGHGKGPWIMTDQENNIVGCANDDPRDKYCPDVFSVDWRFVMATADGEPHHWRTMGGDAQKGELKMVYDGRRIPNQTSSYDPMRKQGAILLGNGGDNSNGSAGTFYEGAMTKAGTFPTEATNQEIQANIVAAKYDVARLTLVDADNVAAPNGVQTFALGGTEKTTVTFVNTTNDTINDLALSVKTPKGWNTVEVESAQPVKRIEYAVYPGQKVVATFNVTSSQKAFNGDLTAVAQWTSAKDKACTANAVEKVRNVNPVTINEYRISDGQGNATNSFIELFNAGEEEVDVSGWSLTLHAVYMPYFSAIELPAGTKIAAKDYYLIGLSNSGLAVQANAGDQTVYVRDVKGISVGDEVEIGTAGQAEKRIVAKIITPAKPEEPAEGTPGRRPRRGPSGMATTLWQPLPDGPVITIPAGSTNIPVTGTDGFQVGQKMAIGYGSTYPAVSNSLEKYEVVTITEVGKPGTQAYLSMDAKAGDTNIKVSSVENISVGDKIRLDIASEGYGIETVTVKKVGTRSARTTFNGPLRPDEDAGTGLDLEEPLKFNHASNMPFSVRGTGISFEPATKFAHCSNEPVLPLLLALELDQPLAKAHAIDEVVFDAKVTTAGYQGEEKPDLWYGGPSFTSNVVSSQVSGNMALRTSKGLLVDVVNYGRIVDLWLSEGYRGEVNEVKSQYGYFAPAPAGNGANVSAGRFPDGTDSDDNRHDFRMQRTFGLAAPAVAGAQNIKVSSTFGFTVGQALLLGQNEDLETVQVLAVGTAGGTRLSQKASAGSKKLLVSNGRGFTVGQEILIGEGDKTEKAVVAAVTLARRGWFVNPSVKVEDTIELEASLRKSYPEEVQVAGTGITLTTPLQKEHREGESLANYLPTPGAKNQY